MGANMVKRAVFHLLCNFLFLKYSGNILKFLLLNYKYIIKVCALKIPSKNIVISFFIA
jgi:hypothetical protein